MSFVRGSKSEFEPRIKAAKERLSQLQGQLQSHLDEQARAQELRLAIDNLEMFSRQVTTGLELTPASRISTRLVLIR